MKKTTIVMVVLSISIMFIWGLINEYLHVLFNAMIPLITNRDLVVINARFLFRVIVWLLAIVAWLCSLIPLITMMILEKRK